jgi:hypothetical protein
MRELVFLDNYSQGTGQGAHENDDKQEQNRG